MYTKLQSVMCWLNSKALHSGSSHLLCGSESKGGVYKEGWEYFYKFFYQQLSPSKASVKVKPRFSILNIPICVARVESCSHMKRNTFHCCSGLRHSSPSPALQHHWTYSCDLIRRFPLATRRHTAKQKKRVTHRETSCKKKHVAIIIIFCLGFHLMLREGGKGGLLGGREVSRDVDVTVSVKTAWTHERKRLARYSRVII